MGKENRDRCSVPASPGQFRPMPKNNQVNAALNASQASVQTINLWSHYIGLCVDGSFVDNVDASTKKKERCLSLQVVSHKKKCTLIRE